MEQQDYKTISFKVSLDEYNSIKESAQRNHQTITAYTRYRILSSDCLVDQLPVRMAKVDNLMQYMVTNYRFEDEETQSKFQQNMGRLNGMVHGLVRGEEQWQ